MKNFFAFCLFTAGFAGLAHAQAPADSSLRTLSTYQGRHLGAAVTFPSGTSTAPYDTMLAREFNTVVCENAMKFGSIEATRGVFNYAQGDAIANFAIARGMYVRGHNLLWYKQAGFLKNLATTTPRDTFLTIIKNHVNNVVGHYKGMIYEWDVVNEAIDETSSDGNRQTKGQGDFSPWTLNGNSASYIDSMFVWAHKADSSAWLVYNDFSAEGWSAGADSSASKYAKSNYVYKLVKGMKERGIPINGVGFQSHLSTFDTAAIGANMSRLEALGLTISITELDVPISSGTDSTQLYTQKATYKGLMQLCLRHPGCKTFVTWGLNDNQSWLGSGKAPLLYSGTTTLAKKPAYYGVREALLGAPAAAVTVPGVPVSVTGAAGAAGSGNVTVSWSAPLSNGNSVITGYKAMAVADTSKSCATTGALTCQVTGLTAGTAYTFVVRAGNSAGFGATSLASAAVTPTVSLLPGGFLVGVGQFTHAYSFLLPETAARLTDDMTLTLSDLSGRVVWRKTVHPSEGIREVSWDGNTQKGTPAPAGMYLARVRTRSGGSVQEAIQKGMKVR